MNENNEYDSNVVHGTGEQVSTVCLP